MKNNYFFNRRVASLDVHSPLYLKTRRSQFGGGDISDLYQLVDEASRAGFAMVQLTPIQDTGLHVSPYMGVSIFSFNPAHLDVEKIKENPKIKKLKEDRLKHLAKKPSDFVDYRRLYKFKVALLEESFGDGEERKINYGEFPKNVLDYAVYKALRQKQKTSWPYWPKDTICSDSKSIIKNHPEIEHDVKFFLYCQSILTRQWMELVKYAREKGVEIALDKPIYPIHDSADVWANQKLFYLNFDKSLKYLSGCDNPQDPFGPQEWGHAVYRFKEAPREVISFYIESIRFMSKTSKVIRLDHSLALIWKYYLIDAKTKKGQHVAALKGMLFSELLKNFPNIFFIAEDVGFVSKRLVDDPLGKFGIPGIRSPQWTDKRKYTKFDSYPALCVAATSNHDTKSILAWWGSLKKSKREVFFRQFGSSASENNEESIKKIINLVFKSRAQIASIAMRDLASDLRRYNSPGVKNSRNWRAQMLVPIEDLDFSAIKKIIFDSGRNSA